MSVFSTCDYCSCKDLISCREPVGTWDDDFLVQKVFSLIDDFYVVSPLPEHEVIYSNLLS